MNELISGKEALIALENGEEVEFKCGGMSWSNLDAKQQPLEILIDNNVVFRLKLRTIAINGIEIPAPFKPKLGDDYFYIQSCRNGYAKSRFQSEYCDQHLIALGAWRTEAEVKRVLEVLRGVLNVN